MAKPVEREEHRVLVPRQVFARDIGLRWVKITETDLFAIRTSLQLTSQVAKSYAIDLSAADVEVQAWMVDRAF